MNRMSWNEISLGIIAGLSILTSPAVGKMNGAAEEQVVRVDNQGSGSLNSGSGSMESGIESVNICAQQSRLGERAF
jgi:hypothetical protein